MPERVLVVDDDASHRRLVAHWLCRSGYEVDHAANGDEALAMIRDRTPDVVLLDVHMSGLDGTEVLAELQQSRPRLPVLMVTGDGKLPMVVQTVRAGAIDYLVKPVARTALLGAVRGALDASKRPTGIKRRAAAGTGRGGMLGNSPLMVQLFNQIDRVAPREVSVLLRGESGTGKELAARALHERSLRSDGPFVAINCAAIAESLQASELFGHEKGAFTGAVATRQGRFEQAEGGTLFLDEVAELSPSAQALLLRVLQERCFERVGGSQVIRANVRIVAASHADLTEWIADGRFRQDLFYRLAVFEVDLPPLRERGDDLEMLAEHFLAEFSALCGVEFEMTDAAMSALVEHDWPGNVRELRNALERASVLADGGLIQLSDLPRRLRSTTLRLVTERPPTTASDHERQMLLAALERHDGNVSQTMRELGIPRTSMYRKLRKHGLK